MRRFLTVTLLPIVTVSALAQGDPLVSIAPGRPTETVAAAQIQTSDRPPVVAFRQRLEWDWGSIPNDDVIRGADAATRRELDPAVQAMQAGRLSEARALATAVLNERPDNIVASAFLALLSPEPDPAREALRHAAAHLAEKPPASHLKFIASGFVALGDREEGIALYRRGLAAFPDDVEFALYLGEALERTGRHEEAVKLLLPAVDEIMPSARLHWNLALAYTGLSKADETVAHYRRVAELDSNLSANRLNSAAYTLADAGWGLADARAMAVKAVSLAEAQMKSLSLATADSSHVTKQRTLGSYWDTLGWTDFKRGDLASAARYLAAAADANTSSGTIADHLGQVYEAQGDKTKAAAAYARALVVSAPVAAADPRLRKLVTNTSARDRQITEARRSLGSTVIRNESRATGTGSLIVLVNADGRIDETRVLQGDAPVTALASALRGTTIPTRLPDGSDVRIMRGGVLSCARGAATCQFLLTAEPLLVSSPRPGDTR